MTNKNETHKIIDDIQLSSSHIKITQLRKDILEIIIRHEKPISALEILKKLKKIRDSAEPPTVYRVIDYLIEHHVVHKVNSENKFIVCKSLDHNHTKNHGIMLICKNCLDSQEIFDTNTENFLNAIANENQFTIANTPLEVDGLCKACRSKL